MPIGAIVEGWRFNDINLGGLRELGSECSP